MMDCTTRRDYYQPQPYACFPMCKIQSPLIDFENRVFEADWEYYDILSIP